MGNLRNSGSPGRLVRAAVIAGGALALLVAAGCGGGGGGSLPKPTITGISPAIGPASGGTTVEITGTNFRSGVRVRFGTLYGAGVSVIDATTLRVETPAHAAGLVDVTVELEGLSGNFLADGFEFLGGVEITDVSPDHGTEEGGDAVTLTGSGFEPGAMVYFGGEPATDVDVDPADDTQLTCTSPEHSPGLVDIIVLNPSGGGALADNAYTFDADPDVTSVSPNHGATAGGTVVNVRGTSFQSGATVTFGGASATDVHVLSSTSITCRTPASAAGAVDVVVTNTNALTGTLTGAFIYSDDDPPHVSSVFPTSGPRAGGTTVTISGSGFLAGAAVELDGAAASSITVVDSETITCDTPAGAAGVADVKVTNTDGQSYTLESGFTYWPRWVATANLATSGVSMFKLDEDTGVLTLKGVEPVTGPTRIDAGDGYLFVTCSGGVAMYAIDPETGDLTLSDTSGTGGTSPTAVHYDPANGFLYVTNYGSNSIAVLAVDSGAGTISPVPGSPFGAAGFGPVALALDDASPMLFVANQASETVAAFDVNAATGELTLASLPPQPTGGDPRALAFGSSGGTDYLFCMNYGDGTVSVYDVSGGALAEVADSPADLGVASTSGCEGLLFDDSGGGARLFVVAQSPSEVLVLDVSAAGALSEVAASPFAPGGQGGQTVIKVGDAVYVALASSAAVWGAEYDDTDGSLTELDGSTYGVGSSSPVDIAADD